MEYSCQLILFFTNTSVLHLAEILLILEEDQYWRAQWTIDHPNYKEDEEDDAIADAHALEKENHFMEVGAKLREVDPDALKRGSLWERNIFLLKRV